MEYFFEWEEQFLMFLQESVRAPWLDRIMQFITSLGDAGFLSILTCLILLCVKKWRRTGKAAALSLLMEFAAVNLFLKNWIARVRPYHFLEGLTLITKEPSDYSFPSGHSGAVFAVASVLFLCAPRRVGIPAVIFAAVLSFSRLYLGAHFPTDVLGGAMIGCLTGWLAWKLVFRKKKLEETI